MKLNTKTPFNNNLDLSVGRITQWHYDRNLIEAATDESQTKKLFEEFIELVAANMPGATPTEIAQHVMNMTKELHAMKRIKTVAPEDAQAAKKDALGDMNVVVINIVERNQWTFHEVLEGAYSEIKDRKGIAFDGTFIKSKDLPDYREKLIAAGLDYDKIIEDNCDASESETEG